MSTVFVTGATGLLGSALTRHLLADGHTVRALARDPDKAERVFSDLAPGESTRLDVVVGDMLDVPAWADAPDGVNTLFHTAAYFRESFGAGDPRARLWAVNVDGTRTLMEAADAAGVARAVHTSSSGVLPRGGPKRTLTEADVAPPDHDWNGNDYFESKHAADQAIRAFLATHRMPVVFVLPGWMFGPGDDGPTGAGKLTLDVMRGSLPAVPNARVCVVDVRDVALAHVRAADALAAGAGALRGERFIVAGPYTPVREVVDGIAEAAGVEAPRATVSVGLLRLVALAHEVRGRLTKTEPLLTRRALGALTRTAPVDSGRAERVLGVGFRPLDETLRDTVAYIRQRGAPTVMSP